MTERAKERSAFRTRRGLFQFTRMPFGLAGASSSFCRLISIVLRDLLWKVCLYYLDDIIIFARTPEELLERLEVVLDRLREVGRKVKPSICALFKSQIHFLGHIISENGVGQGHPRLAKAKVRTRCTSFLRFGFVLKKICEGLRYHC